VVVKSVLEKITSLPVWVNSSQPLLVTGLKEPV